MGLCGRYCPNTRKDDQIKKYITETIEGFIHSFIHSLEHCDWINFPISQFLDEGILDTGNTGLKGCKQEKSELVGGRASRLLFNAWGITSVIFCSPD